MTINLYDCDACISCTPCPTLLALDAWWYWRQQCSGSTMTTVEHRMSFAIPWATGATDVGVLSAVVWYLVAGAEQTGSLSLIRPTLMPKFRPASGDTCEIMHGDSYVSYDPITYTITKLVLAKREQDQSISYIEMPVRMQSSSVCLPCVTNRGVSTLRYRQGAAQGFFLTDAEPDGSTCATANDSPVSPRKIDVTAFLQQEDACCAFVNKACIVNSIQWSGGGAEIISGWSYNASNGYTCTEFTESADGTVSRTGIAMQGACAASPVAGEYNESVTFTGSGPGGSISVTITIERANACAGINISATYSASAATPSAEYSLLEIPVSVILEVGHPCYRYKIEGSLFSAQSPSSAYYGPPCAWSDGDRTRQSKVYPGGLHIYVEMR